MASLILPPPLAFKLSHASESQIMLLSAFKGRVGRNPDQRNGKFRRQIDILQQQIDKQNEIIAKLDDQNREILEKLRQADAKYENAILQKDQTELKKSIKSEINDFLISNDLTD